MVVKKRERGERGEEEETPILSGRVWPRLYVQALCPRRNRDVGR